MIARDGTVVSITTKGRQSRMEDMKQPPRSMDNDDRVATTATTAPEATTSREFPTAAHARGRCDQAGTITVAVDVVMAD
jgi:hypothetical protein